MRQQISDKTVSDNQLGGNKLLLILKNINDGKLVSSQGSADAYCLLFAAPAALQLQLHRALLCAISCALQVTTNTYVIFRHFTLDWTLGKMLLFFHWRASNLCELVESLWLLALSKNHSHIIPAAILITQFYEHVTFFGKLFFLGDNCQYFLVRDHGMQSVRAE